MGGRPPNSLKPILFASLIRRWCMVWVRDSFMFGRHQDHNMKNLSPKKTDWVRFAWILEECGDLSANQISYIFNNMWSNRSRSASSVAQIMVAHRSKGFETVQELTFGHEHIKIWTFYGQIPEINRRTTIRWRKSLNPLRGSV